MAMIKCPKCGELISDKSKKCVHCGEEVQFENDLVCSECGADLKAEDTVCSKCGCPVLQKTTQEEHTQKVEVTGIKLSKNPKKFVKLGILAAIVAVAIIVVVNLVQQANNAKRVKEYGENLTQVSSTMLTGAAQAETCGNLVKQVWYNAIYKEADAETDEYTRPDGYFVSDFNTALSNLFADEEFTKDIEAIEDNQDTVRNMMKELTNPPEEYADAYEAVSDFYDSYLSFTNLVTNPSGSLTTFSQSFNAEDAETLNCYDAVKLYLE